jgi:DNA polymerase I
LSEAAEASQQAPPPPRPRQRRAGNGSRGGGGTSVTKTPEAAATTTAPTTTTPTPTTTDTPPPPTTQGHALYIIDLLAQAHRMAHGLAPANLSTADGNTRTGVAHGLAQLVLSLLRRRARAPATHLAVVVDAPGATWRHERYPQYKAQRLPSPPGFREEVGRALELLAALGLPILAVPGVEADDVVASLAVRALRARAVGGGGEGGGGGGGRGRPANPNPEPHFYFSDVVIVSPDKDFFQLLSLDESRLSLLRLVKSGAEGNTGSGGGVDGGALTTARDFLRLRPELSPWGCSAWADVLALMGDSSDNVPGVKGVGEKTALALVGACGGVEAVLEAARALEEEEGGGAGKKGRPSDGDGDDGGNNTRSNNPLATVKLNRKQREVLASAEGRAAARLALDLVTVQKDLRVPPLRDLGPWGDEGGEEEDEAPPPSPSLQHPPPSDLRESLRLRVPADGGARLMAVLDALEMRKASEQYSKLLSKWASEGRV